MEGSNNMSNDADLDPDIAGLTEGSPGYSYIDVEPPTPDELQETYDRYLYAGGDRVKALERYINQLKQERADSAA